jgi:YkoP domain
MLTSDSGHNSRVHSLIPDISWLGRARLRRFRRSPDSSATGLLCRREPHLRGTQLLWKVVAHGTKPGDPHGLLALWPRWEHFALAMWPTRPIPGSSHGILRVRFAPYQGESLTLPDGTEIRPGMIVGELHCNNQVMLDMAGHRTNVYRAAREDLHCLAHWIAQPGFDVNVQAFFGVTLIAMAAARLGFNVRALPHTLRRRLDRMFMTGLLVLYTPGGLSRVDKGTTVRSYPQEVWLSRRELLRRYGGYRCLKHDRAESHAYLN